MIAPQELTIAQEDALMGLALARVEAAGCKARVTLSLSDDWEAGIQNGKVDSVERACSQGLAITTYFPDGRRASVSTTDLNPETVRQLAEDCVALAKEGGADPAAGLPDISLVGCAAVADLCDTTHRWSEQAAIDLVCEAEALGRRIDKRISASHRSGTSASSSRWRLRDSHGADCVSCSTSFSARVILVAEERGERQTGYDATGSRQWTKLRSAKALAEEAAKRATEAFGWRKPPSGPARVLWDRDEAASLLGLMAGLASGGAVYRGNSCWSEALGTAVASALITVVDQPHLPGAPGSRPCDSEGLRGADCTLIENGVLRMFLTDTYSARRLQVAASGHAGGTSNVQLLPGTATRQQLLEQLGTGLLVTDTHGHGVEPASGHWSKGVSGFWVEKGRIAYPVQEATLAGNMLQMFPAIEALGNDPDPERSVQCPSLLMGAVCTVGGQQ